MSQPDGAAPPDVAIKGVTADDIRGDLRSRHASVLCPVHGVPPKFEVDADGAPIEAFCCEALGQIFRELRSEEDAAKPQE